MRRDRGRVFTTIAHQAQAVEVTESLGRISMDNLREEVENTGAEAVWWGQIAASARHAADQARAHMEVVRAQLRNAVRQAAMAGYPGPTGRRDPSTTVDAINDGVVLHPDFQAAQAAYFAAEEKAMIAESVKYAVVQKGQHLANHLGHLVVQEELARRSATTPAPTRRAVTNIPSRGRR